MLFLDAGIMLKVWCLQRGLLWAAAIITVGLLFLCRESLAFISSCCFSSL